MRWRLNGRYVFFFFTSIESAVDDDSEVNSFHPDLSFESCSDGVIIDLSTVDSLFVEYSL